MRDLVSFNTTEKMLQSKCHDRVMPTEEEISEHMADAAMPPYMPRGPNGPRITMSAAISLINRYCTSLPTDMATKLVPQWTITTVDEESIQKEYECTLRMPINSPLKQIIVSPPMRRKKLAKMAAALIACQLLDEIGELNEDLVPKSRLVDNAIEKELGEIEEEDGNGAIPGTNRRRQIYEKHVPIFLKDIKPKPGKHCYLNILNLVQPFPKVLNPRGRPLFYPEHTARGLALICTLKLPPIHFSDTLLIEGVNKFLPSNAASSYYISPIVGGKIDWNFIHTTRKHSYHKQKLKTKGTIERMTFHPDKFVDAVLMRSYKIDTWKSESPTFHHVIKICDSLTPASAFECDKKYSTYAEYYQEKYNVTIHNLKTAFS
ncbi:endoribonuclease Dicer [Caerostris extrusa]|uniref:Endoribonuclease Dicer n=1 Tax=Caerostris extrusa TaxID=172846 RepID=A0AAV4RZ10_CAEEX|nr:endoribonuclease Dicer [Caerostris extrusa]